VKRARGRTLVLEDGRDRAMLLGRDPEVRVGPLAQRPQLEHLGVLLRHAVLDREPSRVEHAHVGTGERKDARALVGRQAGEGPASGWGRRGQLAAVVGAVRRCARTHLSRREPYRTRTLIGGCPRCSLASRTICRTVSSSRCAVQSGSSAPFLVARKGRYSESTSCWASESSEAAVTELVALKAVLAEPRVAVMANGRATRAVRIVCTAARLCPSVASERRSMWWREEEQRRSFRPPPSRLLGQIKSSSGRDCEFAEFVKARARARERRTRLCAARPSPPRVRLLPPTAGCPCHGARLLRSSSATAWKRRSRRARRRARANSA